MFDLFRENSGGVRIFLIFLLGPTLFIPGGLIAGSCIVVGGAIWAALNAVLRIIPLIIRAITSPEKSARMALAFGRELKLSIFGVKVGNIVGVIGAAISIAISIVAWTIAFPLAIGAIVSFFPVVVQAVVVWVANLPVVGAFLSSVYASLQVAGLALGTALQPVLGAIFGPVLGFLSTFLGLHLSATVVMVGTTLGMLLVSVGVMASGVADGLSDWWASRGARSYVHDEALKPSEEGRVSKAKLSQNAKQPESSLAGALVVAKRVVLCEVCGHQVNVDDMALRLTEGVTDGNTTKGGVAALAHKYEDFSETYKP